MPKSVESTRLGQRVLEHLREEFAKAGHGSLRRISKELGLRPDHLSQIISSGRMDVGIFFAVIGRLQVEPGRFVSGGAKVKAARPKLALPRPKLTLPHTEQALARFESSGCEPDHVDEWIGVWLTRMDADRYDDAGKVLGELLAGVEQVPLRSLPRFLGVCGSAYRNHQVRLDEGEECLRWGMWMAEKLGDRSAMGDLLQRQAYLIADRGEFSKSLELVERACGLHLVVGDDVSVGKTLVDQGIFLGYLERFEDAIEASRLALKYLPESEYRHRFSTLQSLARHHRCRGQIHDALGYLNQAAGLADQVGPWLSVKVLWTRGELLMDLRRYREAENDFRRTKEIYLERSPLATALVTIDLLVAQLFQGRSAEAQETIRSTVLLVERLHANRLAASALMELHRCEIRHLTPTLIKRIKRRLRKAQERSCKRSRVALDQAARSSPTGSRG